MSGSGKERWSLERPNGGALPSPDKVKRLIDCARDGQIVVVRCLGCHRTIYYLARDLVEIVGADHPAWEVPFPCGRCCTDEWMDITLRMPEAGDYGNLTIRRPGPVRQT